MIRYYGCYSNKMRGAVAAGTTVLADESEKSNSAASATAGEPPAAGVMDRQARRRWAMLIKRVYEVDPLVCPKCGGKMKMVSLIEARQGDVIRKILEHCGLWHAPPNPPPRAPPEAPRASQAADLPVDSDFAGASGCGMDPEFREHLHRERQAEQLDLPWEA